MRRRILVGIGAGLGLALLPAISRATVILNFTGTVPVTSTQVDFEAQLTISGDTLTVVLVNDSASIPASTLNPADLLTSFYFAIAGSPMLTYTGASGDVCLAHKNVADDCTVTTNEADLRAFAAGDDTWQFKQGLTLAAGSTTLTYGIGTTGNNSLTPNNFNGNIVGGFDYGIYAGDITTQNLDGTLLVHTTATFTFSGLTGFAEDDISRTALFGLGTQPDSTGLVVPEPAAVLMLGVGVAGIAWFGRRRL